MTKWVIAGKPTDAIPEVDKEYEIRDSRKGTFIGRIVSIDGEWATVERIEGEIKWTSTQNKLFVGKYPDKVSIRASLVYLIELVPQSH